MTLVDEIFKLFIFRIQHSNQINELHVALNSKDKTIEAKDKELDCKATTINQLMSDLKNVTDAKTKVDNTLEKLKKDMEVEKEIQNEKMKALNGKIEQQEVSMKVNLFDSFFNICV